MRALPETIFNVRVDEITAVLEAGLSQIRNASQTFTVQGSANASTSAIIQEFSLGRFSLTTTMDILIGRIRCG